MIHINISIFLNLNKLQISNSLLMFQNLLFQFKIYVSSVIWHAVLYEYLDLDWTGWRSLAVSSMSGYWIQLKTLCSKFSKVPPFLTYNTKWPNTFNNILIEISPLYIELFYENLHQSWLQSDPFQVNVKSFWNATWNHHELICNKHFGNNLKRDTFWTRPRFAQFRILHVSYEKGLELSHLTLLVNELSRSLDSWVAFTTNRMFLIHTLSNVSASDPAI